MVDAFDGFVKFVELLPMQVVSFHVKESETPEEDAWKLLEAWAKPQMLFDNPSLHQVFGFNNPIPKEGDTLRGYEFWLTVPEGVSVNTEGVRTKQFAGGHYAVTAVKGVQNILAVCTKLYHWIKEHEKYKLGYPPGYDFENGPSLELEHNLNPSAADPANMLLDYYLPVTEK
ncbi:effector binding domain-containing protein [Planctomycetota bacterium]